MKKELLLFLTSNYDNNRVNKNLVKNENKLFDEIKLLNENDLDDYILNIINSLIDKYGLRGYGFWIWKAYIIMKELSILNENDVLIFLDSHCIEDNLKDKFDEILTLLNEQPIILGKSGFNDYMFTTSKLKKHVEKYLNYKFSKDQLNQIQYEGGLIFIRNCKESFEFIKQWFDIMISNIECVTDIYNNDKLNHSSFVDNRHDQSVVSLLYKYYNYTTPPFLDWEFMHKKINKQNNEL